MSEFTTTTGQLSPSYESHAVGNGAPEKWAASEGQQGRKGKGRPRLEAMRL